MKGIRFLDFLMPALLRHQGNRILREEFLEGFSGRVLFDDSKWNVRVWTKDEILRGDGHDQGTDGSLRVQDLMDEGFVQEEEASPHKEEIQKRLCWTYPYESAMGIPSKISVTELGKRLRNEWEAEDAEGAVTPLTLKKPKFIENKVGFDEAKKGTILHFVMQIIDLARVGSVNEVLKQLEEMKQKDLLTEIEVESVDPAKIMRFFDSPIGKRLRGSKEVHREIPFNLAVDSKQLFKTTQPDLVSSETVLLQGIMDCYFREGNGYVLLDYKTDFVKQNAKEAIKNRYRLQMEYYGLALKTLSGLAVLERYIYLFHNGEWISF
jgi:ATP-dependent helicase/nuclease subunit A